MRSHVPWVLVVLSCSTVRLEPREATADGMEGLWVLQIRRQAWQPRDLEFVLRVGPDGDGTATVDPVFIGRTTATLSDLDDGDRVRFTLHSKGDDNVYRFDARRDGGTLDGVVRWHDGRREQLEPFTAHRREVRRFDFDVGRFPVERDPLAVGVEPVLLDRLVLGAETARSDALLVLSDGRLVAARTFGGADVASSVGSLSREITTLAHGDQRVDLRPSELAALGQALLDDGEWTGEPALPEPWTAVLLALAADPSPTAWTVQPDPTDDTRPLGFGHLTAAGEGLLVYPEARLVVVRTLRRTPNGYDRRYDDRDEMEWLDQMAEAIAVEKLR